MVKGREYSIKWLYAQTEYIPATKSRGRVKINICKRNLTHSQ